MGINAMSGIIERRKRGEKAGIYSACTANQYVIEAVMEKGKETNTPVLIEATANQVNQFGGYTGMKPVDFAEFVYDIAGKTAFPKENIILGGDHLGPLNWQNEPEEAAMMKSEELIRQYVLAGFTKIHIDTSMRVASDDKEGRFPDELIARRAARLAKVSEEAYESLASQNKDASPLVYVIGSEVPIPGGAKENNEEVSVTRPEQFKETYETFQQEFTKIGLEAAFQKVIGVVVQPGVEFSDLMVTEYNREAARNLCAALREYPDIVFEGHSTDYQTKTALREMVEDGIAILKVGPALTFALRQGLFALNDIENEVLRNKKITLSRFRETLEEVMLSNPGYWKKYYTGGEDDIALKRKYSFSDRCRYYLPDPKVVLSIETLLKNINSADIPIAVIEQYLPVQYTRLREGKISLRAEQLLKDRVKDYIGDYLYAIG